MRYSDRCLPTTKKYIYIYILNRVVRWTNDCLLYTADPRHVEKLLKGREIEGCKSLTTPGVKEASSMLDPAWSEQQPEGDAEDLKEPEEQQVGDPRGLVAPRASPEESRELSRAEIRHYRSAVARCTYLPSDRFEIAFPTKELCRGMANTKE